jgi:hypothetical protein
MTQKAGVFLCWNVETFYNDQRLGDCRASRRLRRQTLHLPHTLQRKSTVNRLTEGRKLAEG